jgi:hypothetical protein
MGSPQSTSCERAPAPPLQTETSSASFMSGLVCGSDLLDILERQKQLLGVELLRMSAELGTLQLAQKMAQAINLRQRAVPLGDGGVTFRTRRRDQRIQRFDIGRKLMRDLAHALH